MIEYITKSFEKFKQDGLSKLFYDILKWIIPTLLVFASTKLFPKNTTFDNLISNQYTFSLYTIILSVLIVITLTILVVNTISRKKYLAIRKDNFTDELTGLKNHKALKEYLTNKLIEVKQNSKTVSLILIDIDNFKKFNTAHGFNTADKIMGKLGELLGNDKRATDEIFRQFLKGDEFLVIANETSLSEARQAAERKRKLIEEHIFKIDEGTFTLTVSCGVTELKKTEDNYQTFTDRVNMALIEAKKQPDKNCTKTLT